jgi:hypothetical protein
MNKRINIGTPLFLPVLHYSSVVYDSEDIAPIHAYADTCSCIYIFVSLNASADSADTADTADMCKLNQSKLDCFNSNA